ncbi:2280_t:CDS:2 [Racocetra fulgida]|uniref:cyclin-dependent kinase n=1 Tax=Racocetra fulgida TaxID=60492 RepID=A0A9N9C6K0_9GLOM|nr:2280_t:CDS:2 [Racocetra fulgida]
MGTNTFEILEICGDGTFGIVYKAKQKSTETFVAIKRAKEVKYERPVQERIPNEIEILRKVQHENSLLKDYTLSPHEVKSCIWMILTGVVHIHNIGVIHRDLSPSNILISDSGVIKISDFGIAWVDSNNGYEPRELLYSAENYSNAIDLWSLGCIFAEFFTKPASSPLFHGENDIEQLSEIFRILGVPDESTWPMIDFPDYGKFTFIQKDCDGLTIKHLPKAKSQDALLDPLFDTDDFSKFCINIQDLKKRI